MLKSVMYGELDDMLNLSIVFQGPLLNDNDVELMFFENIRETRTHFPLAEIIVSTIVEQHSSKDLSKAYEKIESLGGLLIVNEDPGGLQVEHEGVVYRCNLNRMLMSSYAGVSAATRPLTIKLRTDSSLTGNALKHMLLNIDSFDSAYVREDKYTVFSSRIINCSQVARDARGSLPYLHHPSDILLAGKTCDVKLFYGAPLAEISELYRPIETNRLSTIWRFVPEQWCWVHAINKIKGGDVFQGNDVNNLKDIEDSERFILSNFVMYEPKKLNFKWNKYRFSYFLRGMFSLLTHRRWLSIYSYYHEHGFDKYAVYRNTIQLTIWGWREFYRLRNTVFAYMPRIIKKGVLLVLGRK